MKLNLLFSLALLLGAFFRLQAQAVDSQEEVLSKAQTSADKMALLKALADSTYPTNKERSEYYVNTLYREALRVGDDAYLAVAGHRRGNLMYAAGRPDSARVCYLSAYQTYLKARDTSEALTVYCRAGIMQSLAGDYAGAEKIYRSAIRRASGRTNVLAFAYNQMGTLYHYQGIADSARHYYGASTALFAELQDTAGMLRPMYNHAVLLMESDKIPEATTLFLNMYDAQKRIQAIGDLYHTTQALAHAYSCTYDHPKALQYALESYRYAQQLQDISRMPLALTSVANVHMANRDTTQAIQYLTQACDLADSAQLRDQQQSIRRLLGEAYRQQGKYDAAVAVLTEGLALADGGAASRMQPFLWHSLGQTWLALGELQKAEQCLYETIRLAEPVGLNTVLGYAYATLAELYLKRNAPRKAIEWGLKVNQSSPDDDNYHERARRNASTLHQAYKQLGLYREALQYHELYKSHSDSLNDAERIRQTTIQGKDFAFALEKQQLETERRQSEALLRAQDRFNKIIAVAFGVCALLGFGFFFNARRKNRIIAETNRQLEQLNLTKDRIFAIIGHDLRRPALAFRGITEKVNYLLRKQDFDTLHALGRQIEQDAQALHQLTDNLLAWALTQKNVLPYNPVVLSVKRECEEALALFQSVADNKNIAFDVRIPADQTVHADKNTLQTMLRNLLDNAVKFSPPGSTVTLSTVESEAGVTVSISNPGTGIPGEKLRDIFLLQKDKSEPGTAGEKGIGLGLHLVHELVQLNRGRIEILSRPDADTEVRLTLPVRS